MRRNDKDVHSAELMFTRRLMRVHLSVCVICIVGIAIGSFCDFDLSMATMGTSEVGATVADFGLTFVDLFYAFAGTCLYKGFKAKGPRFDLLAKVLLGIGVSMPFIFHANGASWNVRALMGYEGGSSSPVLALVSLLPMALVIAAIPLFLGRFLDDKDPDRLIAIGVLLIVSGIWTQYANDLLKPLASRPRPRYLATLDDPASAYRAWWQFIPYASGPSDAVGSWPSNHTMLAALMLNLPLVAVTFRHRSRAIDYACIVVACLYLLVMACNRILMGAHFLTDVCSGALITCCLLILFDAAFLRWRERRA